MPEKKPNIAEFTIPWLKGRTHMSPDLKALVGMIGSMFAPKKEDMFPTDMIPAIPPMAGIVGMGKKLWKHVTPTKNVDSILKEGFKFRKKYRAGITDRNSFRQRETEALGVSLTDDRRLIDYFMMELEDAPWASKDAIRKMGPRSVVTTKANIKDKEVLDLVDETISYDAMVKRGYMTGPAEDYMGFDSLISGEKDKAGRELNDLLEKYWKGKIKDFKYPARLTPDLHYIDMGMPWQYTEGMHPGKITKFLQGKGYKAINYPDELRVFDPKDIEVLGAADKADPLYRAWLEWSEIK